MVIIMKNIAIILYILFLFPVSNCLAGNLSLIEKRIKELDTLNKQAVQQKVKIPKKGIVNATFNFPPGNKIKDVKVKKLKITELNSSLPFTVQVASGTEKERVFAIAKNLNELDIPAFVSTTIQHLGTSWWRIYVGAYPDRRSAIEANKELQKEMFPKGFVTHMPYALQIGDEILEQNAPQTLNEIQKASFLPYTVPGNRKGYARILLGAFRTETDALKALEELKEISSSKTAVLR